MRLCSNSACKAPIYGCFGTIKAGDFLEALAGTRIQSNIRELCPKCATKVVHRCESGEDPLLVYPTYGWGPQVAAPVPS
jgi:hypothetical protein